MTRMAYIAEYNPNDARIRALDFKEMQRELSEQQLSKPSLKFAQYALDFIKRTSESRSQQFNFLLEDLQWSKKAVMFIPNPVFAASFKNGDALKESSRFELEVREIAKKYGLAIFGSKAALFNYSESLKNMYKGREAILESSALGKMIAETEISPIVVVVASAKQGDEVGTLLGKKGLWVEFIGYRLDYESIATKVNEDMSMEDAQKIAKVLRRIWGVDDSTQSKTIEVTVSTK